MAMTNLLVLVFAALALGGGNADIDGTLVVLNKAEATASLIDLGTGEEMKRLPTGVGPHEAAVSADGRYAAVANYGAQTPGNSLTIIDLQEKKIVRTIDLGNYRRPHGILFHPDGKQLIVTCEAAQSLVAVNWLAGSVTYAVETNSDISHMVDLTPDGRLAFVANIRTGSTTAIDLEKRKVVKQIPTGAGAEGIAVSPNRAEVWVTNRAADTVSIIDTGSLEVVHALESKGFPIRIKFTPDGSLALVSNAQAGEVAVFDTARRIRVATIPMEVTANEKTEGRLFQNFEGSPVPVGILIEPSGKRAFVANTNADVVTVIDLEELKVVGRLTAGKEPDGMAYSPLVISNK